MKTFALTLLFLLIPQAILAADSFPAPDGWEVFDKRHARKYDIMAREEIVRTLSDSPYPAVDAKQAKFLFYRAEGDFNNDGRKDVARFFTKKDGNYTDGYYTETALIVTFDKGNKKFEHVVVDESLGSKTPIRTSKAGNIKDRVCETKEGSVAQVSEVVFDYEGMQNQKGECRDFTWKGVSLDFFSVEECGCGASYLWDGKKFIYYQSSVCEGC